MSNSTIQDQGLSLGRNSKLRFRTLRGSSVFGRAAVACSLGATWVLSASLSFAQDEPTADDELAAAEQSAPVQAAEEDAAIADAAAEASALEPGAVAVDAAPEEEAAAADAAPAEAAAEEEKEGLDEVVVTVDRRRRDLQDYSGTAAAFSADKLTAVGVDSVEDLGQMVPGLQIGVNNGGATVYIRGVGSNNTTELGDPAVAQHVDGVYLPRFRGLGAAFLDVERIEVNSGPQGTVRGRNATGGAINVISKKPVIGEYQANAIAALGSYNRREFQGMINLPIGDTAAFRFAGSSLSVDPTWENAGPMDHLPGAQGVDNYAMKGSILWEPTEKLSITIAGDYTLERGTGWGGDNVIGLLQNRSDNDTPLNLADDFYDPIDPNNRSGNIRKVYRKGRRSEASLVHYGGRFNAHYDAGPVNIELLASHRYQDYNLFGGSNLGPFASRDEITEQQWDDWSYAEQRRMDSASSIGELRFSSDEDQQLVWSFGLFGFYEDQGAALGQITADRDGGFNEFNMPSTRGSSFAAYGDATFKVTENFRLLAGLRYTIEHKDRLGGLWMIGSNLPQGGLDRCARQNDAGECVEIGLSSQDIGRYGTEGFRYRLLDRPTYVPPSGDDATNEDRVNFYLDGIESFGARDQIGVALCNDPDPQFQQQVDSNQDDIRLGQDRFMLEDGNLRCAYGIRQEILDSENAFTNARPQNGRRNDNYADFRVGMEYDLAKDNMLYATLSSAHKAGGFNDSLPNPDYDPADEDSLGEFITPDYGTEVAYSLEVGSKNLLMDRKLRLNASAFAFMYEGLQFQTIITVGEPPPLDAEGNPAIDPTTGLPFPDNRGGAAARQNAEEPAVIYGLDADATYALPFGLEAGLHALFMDARFPDDTLVNDGRLGLGGVPAQVDIGGYWLPRVSPYTFNYNLTQVIFSDLGQFDWVIQGQTRGEHFMTPYNGDGTRFAPRGPGWGVNPISGEDEPIEAENNAAYSAISNNLERLDDRVPVYTTVNIGAGWKHPDGRLSIRGFVNNLFNVTYANTIISDTNNIRNYNDPRMAGVRVRMDW